MALAEQNVSNFATLAEEKGHVTISEYALADLVLAELESRGHDVDFEVLDEGQTVLRVDAEEGE